MNKNDSLKEYYVKLHTMYNNAVNMLTAINQSLSTSASEVTVEVADTDDTTQTVRIPSFLYLENKLEQLDANFSALFEMPQSGDAWFTKDSDMFKLEMVKATSAPAVPEFSNYMYAQSRANTLLKDLVIPKTFLKFNLTSVPENIDKICMKKLVLKNSSIYDLLASASVRTYAEFKAALYNYTIGSDYEEYDSVLDMPIKRDEFSSSFQILEIPELSSGNPWTDYTIGDDGHTHLQYRLRLNTITYTDQEDTSIAYNLKAGDYVCLKDSYNVFKVKSATQTTSNNSTEYYVILEEYIGHQALQTYDENQNMVLELYNTDYSKYHYVEVPLEENQYIVIFLSTLYNNIRSEWSEGILVDLDTIYMQDSQGNVLYNGSTPVTYMDFYNTYCVNVGDLILALTQTAQPQVSNFVYSDLYLLTNGTAIKATVSETLDAETILAVKKINSHLNDDSVSENIISLHEQKSELNSNLQTVQDNIDQIYTQLTNTDFNQEVNVTQESLRAKLDTYYQERITLQKQVIAVVDNINILKSNVKGLADSKYRIRGTAVTSDLEEYLHETFTDRCDIIGMDVEYKYKSTSSDTTTLTNINNSVFTDWIKYVTIEKDRKLNFTQSGYYITYENYDTTSNVIKWNQIDIPIQQGEDVVIRVRYKYNIGQPFINLYTPWSEEITVSFPTEYEENSQVNSILETNDSDVTQASFNNTLITEGYEEHISNKLIDNSQTFYHMPENIYSGFNTAENKLISLKDKLTSMSNEIEEYKSIINNELNSNYTVFITWENNSVQLHNETANEILINDAINGSNDSFIQKNMNIIIRNNSDVPIKFYSIFPGNTDVPLLLDEEEFYQKYLHHYDNVPLLYGTASAMNENTTYQTLGQWIYFRRDDAFTNKNLDYNVDDYLYVTDTNKTSSFSPKDYLMSNQQMMLASRPRTTGLYTQYTKPSWNVLNLSSTGEVVVSHTNNNDQYDYSSCSGDDFLYKNYADTENNTVNNVLYKYEHLIGVNTSNGQEVYLSANESISSFISNYSPKANGSAQSMTIDDLNGAFLIPQLATKNQLQCSTTDTNQYYTLEVGKAISIPILFEYYLDGKDDNTSVTKTLCFDVRTSLFKDPEHYTINVTGKYDFTGTSTDMNNLSTLYDSLITE